MSLKPLVAGTVPAVLMLVYVFCIFCSVPHPAERQAQVEHDNRADDDVRETPVNPSPDDIPLQAVKAMQKLALTAHPWHKLGFVGERDTIRHQLLRNPTVCKQTCNRAYALCIVFAGVNLLRRNFYIGTASQQLQRMGDNDHFYVVRDC